MPSHANDVVPGVEGNAPPPSKPENSNEHEGRDATADRSTWTFILSNVWSCVTIITKHLARWYTAMSQPLGFLVAGISMILGIMMLTRLRHLEAAMSKVFTVAAPKSCVTVCPKVPQPVVLTTVTATMTMAVTTVVARFMTEIKTEIVAEATAVWSNHCPLSKNLQASNL